MIRPKMPAKLSARKTVQVGHLYAICEHGYYEPKVCKTISYKTLKSSQIKHFRII